MATLTQDTPAFVSFELCATLAEARAKALAAKSGNARVVVTPVLNVAGGGQILFSRRTGESGRLFLVHREG